MSEQEALKRINQLQRGRGKVPGGTEPAKVSIPNPTRLRLAPTDPERLEAHERAKARQKRHEQVERARKLWRDCGIPKRHAEHRPDLSGQWGEKCEAIAGRLGTGQVAAMLGNRGTGKTQMAARLCRIAAARGLRPRYVRAMDVFLAIRATYDQADRSEQDVVSEYAKPAVLVLDEVHERGGSDWERRVLSHLIDQRYGEMRDTVLIANQQWADFQESVGASIADRLRETGGIVQCDWGSYRG